MFAPPAFRSLRLRALVVALAWAALDCGRSPGGGPLEVQDLLSLFADAELRSDALDLPFLVSRRGPGWARVAGTPQAPVLWSRRGTAVLELPLQSRVAKELRLRARLGPALGPRRDVALAVNGHAVGVLRLTPEEQDYRLVIPEAVQVEGNNPLGFSLEGGVEPGKGGHAGKVVRGFALSALETRPLGSGNRAAEPALEEGRLRLPPGSSAAFYLRQPAHATLAIEAEAGTGGATRLEVALETDAGRKGLAQAEARPRGRVRVAVPLPAAPGSCIRLELANPGAASLFVKAARLEAPRPVSRSASHALPGRPNLIVFLVDTLRADYLGAYGHPASTSPRFDGFAREAILFDDAIAQAPWTRSAVASLFTGLHVGTHGVDLLNRRLGAQSQTLAETVKAAGFRTGGFFASWVVRSSYGFSQGFDSWNDGEDPSLYWAGARKVVDRALKWIDSGQGPFFLYVHTLEPHSPYNPRDEYWAPFRFEYKGETDTRTLLESGRWADLEPDAMRYLKSRYQGEVLQNDQAFGVLLDGLRERGLLDDSILVFLSDHGEEFREHGGTEHGKTLYREVIRIPLAVRLPRATRGGQHDTAPIQQIDLMPTLLGLLGVAPPQGLEGRDLSGRWLGEARNEEPPPALYSEVRFEIWDKIGVRVGGRKLIRNFDLPPAWRTSEALELYDIAGDPGESRNLAAQLPITARCLSIQLQALRRVARARQQQAESIVLGPEDRAALKALGYVQ